MPEDKKNDLNVKEDIQMIKEWMAKQPHLPKIDDAIIARFLHGSYFRLERTKSYLESFFTIRTETPELFCKRDPLDNLIHAQFAITYFCNTTTESGRRHTFWQLNDPSLSRYDFFACLKAFFMQTDCWFLEDKNFSEQDIVVLDMKGIPLKIITMVNLSTIRTCFKYLLEALPTRLQEVHAINCPPFMDKLFGLVRPFLPPEIFQLIHFHHPGSDTLYKFIAKDNVPQEFGGTGSKADDMMKEWIDLMIKNREFYLNDNTWICDNSKRQSKKYAEDIDLMKGSFRTLCVD